VLFLAWLWFVNLYNFIDGIDGIAGSLTAMAGLGIVFVAMAAGLDPVLPLLAAATGGAALGFLAWNWHPARIFLGDVGSVPLGFVVGGLLILLACRGEWAAALILPGYALGDATLTLLGRMVRGERFWRPHREHFYQRAVQGGLSHDAVVRRILLVQTMLLLLAAASLAVPPAARFGLVGLAALLVLAALRWLAPVRVRAKRRA
jgi:UDP-N-acetylmuramyl pentapeptide phosphotransferase/UDP-N-acetylglucosamine-1-phosphate transferase